MNKSDLPFDVSISPHFLAKDFLTPSQVDDQIQVFADRVRGWQLDIAERIAQTERHGGFAVLGIILNYFESIQKFKEGAVTFGESESHFVKGAEDVLQPLIHHQVLSQVDLHLLYREARNAMYHGGMTGIHIFLTGDQRRIRERDTGNYTVLDWPIWKQGDALWIHPPLLVEWVQRHFSRYVAELANPHNETLRRNFKARFEMG